MVNLLKQLGVDKGLPAEAIRAADADRTAMVPVFLEALERAGTASRAERNALFFVFHLLGQWREKSAYRPLAAFLRRPPHEVESILSDATTETSHRVMAAIFDGDPQPLYDVILDPAADEFIRARMCDALAMVALRGELPREEAARFLESCYATLQSQDECFVWEGWQRAVAMLGLAELKPLVKQAFERGLTDDFEYFERDLQRALRGEPAWRPGDRQFELFGDTVGELSRWHAFQPKDQQKRRSAALWSRSAPAVNQLKNVGRNDPCPCGSGKKFKKCCLGKVEAAATETDPSDDPFESDPEFGKIGAPTYEYDPLVEPDAQDWLGLDEDERVDVVLEYHQREGIDLPNERAHAIIHAVVENQIAEGDALPVRRVAQRLMAEGLDRHDAIHTIGWVLAGHMNDLVREADTGQLINPDRDPNEAYFAELERLTPDAWRRSAAEDT